MTPSPQPRVGDFSYGTVRRGLPRLVAVDIPLRHPASRVTSKVSGAVPTRTSAGDGFTRERADGGGGAG